MLRKIYLQYYVYSINIGLQYTDKAHVHLGMPIALLIFEGNRI